jgi:hypothetical protein
MRLTSFLEASVALWLMAHTLVGYAQTTCPRPKQDVVIYFGNGIDTSPENAKRSQKTLQESLGTTYNGATLRYDLAYNQTSGIALDLVQSIGQAGIQWSSQVSGWLNNLSLMPDSVNAQFQQLMREISTLNATELGEHVKNYQSDILLGQKVLVVAHSQGNFYVNEAKKLLAQALTAEQMRSFSIYGVAVPANNVGGSNAPYLTNHRDLIRFVPSALPSNWTLRRADGSAADDRGLVEAHSFVDTYMSSDFDIRAPLVIGIKGQITNTLQPALDCDNYKKYFLGLMAGTYTGTSNRVMCSVSVGTDGKVIFPSGSVDLSGDNVSFNFLSRQIISTSAFGDNKGIELDVSAPAVRVGGSWNLAGGAKQLIRSDTPDRCANPAGQETGQLAKPLDIAKSAVQLIQSRGEAYSRLSCTLINNATGTRQDFPRPTPAFIEADMLHIGERQYALVGDRVSEFVFIPPATSFSPANYEPQFSLEVRNSLSERILLTYNQFKKITSIVSENGDSSLFCNSY